MPQQIRPPHLSGISRSPYYDPYVYDQIPANVAPFAEHANPYQQVPPGLKDEDRASMIQGLAPSPDEFENQQAADKVQFSDQQNIKCSIEIKNGIP